jgi:ethanolamine-phosphate cytidylyltransferase
MPDISFLNQESLFYFLSRVINVFSDKPEYLHSISEFWSDSNKVDKNELYFYDAINLCEDFLEDFKVFIKNSKGYTDFKLPEVHNIEENPVLLQNVSIVGKNTGDPDRIYMDGCFDLMHSGHFNAIRQAKALGKTLVVGVHSDLEIARNKGPPVMNEQERYSLARACKWVDEVIEDAPYSPTIELLNSLNCMYAAHGDDLSINENGDDCMSILKRVNRCKIFKRTEGISTTQIVGKLLLMTKDAWQNVEAPIKSNDLFEQEVIKSTTKNKKHLLTTSRRISEFSNKKEPKPGDVIVYMDGTFDLFHIGHVETIKRAKELGDYLIVGIHDDQTVNYYKGSNFPIMELHDRVMCVLSTKWVDEVVIGAPWNITKELITDFNIKLVVQGTVPKGDPNAIKWRKGSIDVDEDPYTVPKDLGIYREVESVNKLDTNDIITRIIHNRVNFFTKFQTFVQREKKYEDSKQYIQEV